MLAIQGLIQEFGWTAGWAEIHEHQGRSSRSRCTEKRVAEGRKGGIVWGEVSPSLENVLIFNIKTVQFSAFSRFF